MKSSVQVDIKSNNSFFLAILKGSLIALSVTLIGVLIFAFILRFFAIPDAVITPVNQIIKYLSILVGCIVGLKRRSEMGLVSGLLIGVMYTIISFVVFSILDGNFEFSKTLINDILFGGIAGAVCGIISVNFFKKSK